MGQTRLEQKYQCWNDCVPQGCPGHAAVLQYQSVSNSLHFEDGKGQEIYMQTPELEAFLTMIHTLGRSRTEIESVLKDSAMYFVGPDGYQGAEALEVLRDEEQEQQ